MRRRDLLAFPLARREEAARPAAPRHAPGASPGTLPEHRDAAPPAVYVIAYGPHEVTEFAVEDLEQLRTLRGRWPVLWVNVDGVRHAPTLQRIAEIFDLHRLALEDIADTTKQPLVEVFEDQLLVVAKMIRLIPELDLEQVSIFTRADCVITFQERPGDPLEPVRQRIRRGVGRIRRAGTDYLAYALLDAIVDHCFPVVERYMERLDQLEDDLIASPGRSLMLRLHRVRRELAALRRALYPLGEALRALVREPPEKLVAPETVVYLRDVRDHTLQVVDLVESSRELTASLTDLYLSSVGQRTNDIMKVLTVFAALFIPLGFIASVYGMNLDVAPWWLRSLEVAEGTMALITVLLLALFWFRGWMGERL